MKRSRAAAQSSSRACATGDSVHLTCPSSRLAERLLVVGSQRQEVDHLAVDEIGVEVEDVGDAAGHAGREVATGPTEHDGRATRHVLAAVVTDALDDRVRAGVAHAEALADDAAQEEPGRSSRHRR